MKKHILVLTGRNGCGKDFFADVFDQMLDNYSDQLENRPLKKLTFGDAIKDHTLFAFPWLIREAVYNSRLKDIVYEHDKNINKLTPRQIIHKVSDGLQAVDPYIFTSRTLELLKDELFSDVQFFVVTDMRIQREYVELLKLREQGYSVVFVKILDDNTTATKDKFEDWVVQFNNYDHIFMNHKDGPSPIIHFLKNLYEHE